MKSTRRIPGYIRRANERLPMRWYLTQEVRKASSGAPTFTLTLHRDGLSWPVVIDQPVRILKEICALVAGSVNLTLMTLLIPREDCKVYTEQIRHEGSMAEVEGLREALLDTDITYWFHMDSVPWCKSWAYPAHGVPDGYINESAVHEDVQKLFGSMHCSWVRSGSYIFEQRAKHPEDYLDVIIQLPDEAIPLHFKRTGPDRVQPKIGI